jgi:hypothetical protein
MKLPTVRMEVADIIDCESKNSVREVEVLTVNFNSGTMRIRYVPKSYFGKKNKKYVIDVSNKPFLEKYELHEK